MKTKLTWRPSSEADEYGDFILTARASGGLKFVIYPGSFFTLVAYQQDERLFRKTANTPAALMGAATRYVKAVSR